LRTKLSVILGTVGAVALAACSDSTGPSQSFQLIGGTYTASLTYTIENSLYDSTFVVPGTIDMLDANRTGQFTGTWHIGSGADTATGVIVGQFAAGIETDTIQWLQFGDAIEPPLISSQTLQQLVPQCAVTSGKVILPGSGTIVGKQLSISGTFDNFNCVSGADTVTSTLAASVVATNTTGPM
jgi:hypothetical protein